MAQSGYTPISLYFSATGAAVPSAGNLVAGELALNTNDGKLYFKNSSGVVTLLAGSTSGPAGGSTTQVQYNNAGVLAGITGATSNGTALTLVAPNLGSPSSVGTMPAFTLGGTVSGGGNQINNVVIGASTPLAGAFTTLSATNAITAGTDVKVADGGYIYSPTGSASGTVKAGTQFNGSGSIISKISDVTVTNTSSTGLAVTGTLSATGTLSGGTSGTAYSFSGSAPATSLTLNSSGNLGIGTSSPTAGISLDKYGTAWNPSANTYPYPAGKVYLAMASVAAQDNWLGFTGGYGNSSGSANILLQANLNNTSQQAGNFVGSFVTGAASADLQFGTMTAAATNAGNSVKNEQMRLTSSGNLGLGVTPSAWTAGKAIQVNDIAVSLWGVSGNTVLCNNSYYNTTDTYATTSGASQYAQFNGKHIWYTAPSGTAGNAISFTQAMTLDGSGILTISAYGAGAATFSAAGVISSVSDETWKIKDGVPTDPDAMLKKLEPGYWYYNEEKAPTFGADRQLGFYAQNVNASIGPEAAPTPEEGKPWGYYDRSVLAITVMSLQKALATIETLTARITALETA
jgi:hypothetical protein